MKKIKLDLCYPPVDGRCPKCERPLSRRNVSRDSKNKGRPFFMCEWCPEVFWWADGRPTKSKLRVPYENRDFAFIPTDKLAAVLNEMALRLLTETEIQNLICRAEEATDLIHQALVVRYLKEMMLIRQAKKAQ